MEFAVYTINKRGIFSSGFDILENDKLVYKVEKPSFWKFNKFDFINTSMDVVMRVQKISLFTNTFEIIDSEGLVATVKKNMFKNFYESDSKYGHHTIKGKFWNNEYTISDENDEIAKVSRKRFKSKGKYGIAIKKGINEKYILALVIAIDMVLQSQKNN